MIQKISVLIPVYNEEQYVEDVLQALRNVRLPSPVKMEIILIDDGSTDRTREILQRHDHDDYVITCYLERNRGKGAAIQEGLKQATGDVVIIQDADLEYSVDDFPRLLEPFLSGTAQVVYGSRFLGSIQGMKLPNRVFNILIRWLTNRLYGSHITDEATAYKLLKTDLLRSLHLESRRFNICPEITAKVLRQKIPILEIPITYRGRTEREGKKVGWKDAVSALFTLLKYKWKN